MKLSSFIALTAFVLCSAFAESSFAVPTKNLPSKLKSKVQATYLTSPLTFEENQGQVDGPVKFLSRGPGYTLFLTPSGAVLSLENNSKRKSSKDSLHSIQGSTPLPEKAFLRMQLVGANLKAKISGQEPLPSKSHYLIGNDPTKWQQNVSHYAKVKYDQVFPGVDLLYYGNHHQLEFDFVVAPRATPDSIVLSFSGTDTLEIDSNGNLVLHFPRGAIQFHKPFAYQMVDGVQQPISASFVQQLPGEVTFSVAAYDSSQPLVIDPILLYSTYVGGNAADDIQDLVVDAFGHVYVAGETESNDYPTTLNAFQPTSIGSGGRNAFVTKFNPSGSGLIYSTYLGGSSSDSAFGLTIDDLGHAYVVGETSSSDFPTLNAFQSVNSGSDAFVTKLSPAGDALIYSSFLGGSAGGDTAFQIALDSLGNAYVVGLTKASDFPTLNPFQATPGDNEEAFLTKVNASGNSLIYSTYLGGTKRDLARGIAVDSSFNAYVAGLTESSNFPTLNGFQNGHNGSRDAFLTKFDATGSALIYSTYLGGIDREFATGVRIDSFGNAFVTGRTDSLNFPVQNAFQSSLAGGSDAFISKFNAAGNALLYSTFLGGTGTDGGDAIAIDATGNAYIAGITASADFPLQNAFQNMIGISFQNAYVTVLNPSGAGITFSSYLGGSAGDFATGIGVDGQGNIYVSGRADSPDFPVTSGVFQDMLASARDGFVVKIGDNQLPVAEAGPPQVVEATSPSGATVTLDGSASDDPDGDPLAFIWTGPFLEGGGMVTGEIVMVTLSLGMSNIDLLVDDNNGGTDADSLGVSVVDTIAPETSIISLIDGDGVTLINGDGTFSPEATFAFAGTDTVGIAGFECSFDGGPFSLCSTPLTFTNLGVGSHSFDVRAFDASSNLDGTPASFSWSVLTPEDAIQDIMDTLDDLIQSNPGTPLADKLEDVVSSLQDALGELNKNPPDRQAAMGKIEGAVGDLEAAVDDGLLDPIQGAQFLNELTGIARLLAANAIAEGIAQGGDPGDIAEAQQFLTEGDVLRTAQVFKDAVNKYKDALSKAEGALP